ncbi:ClpXP protease specificity-enhancing factor [Halorhodospira halochloris]|uniref:Stringent starvation protein B n=1 Tax=Halorhodospira halochloris TaxID=1052 RepID=A0A110B5L4_HALHR|nr:ClpXP protease specificity-enhancing factor [Halorhodospira halochloris]MBK1651662.1 ClpXP protease specificity-enhancing factor [Halorhodospira halochloris]MCG5529584.1 ClpXP protease specificity-enhancing factor [Halorhodospira halochloris]MCG5548137.1 ClpXP protease specificity-enhancing factor [Halorhodospira halochloris]BAU58526.1 stringent starvation protein B [Halorhodospira halochloris]
MNSSRPYLVRAIYEWIADNDKTPYLLVDASRSDIDAPTEYAEDGRLVLNVSPRAVQGLNMGNDVIRFSARFGGVARGVTIPVGAVMAVYARENGQGMMFGAEDEMEEETNQSGEATHEVNAGQDPDGGDDAPGSSSSNSGGGKRPNLRVVK